MCALSLYTNDAVCKFFMQKQKSSIRLFYDKDETTNVLNSKEITQNYSLMKENNVCNVFKYIYMCIHTHTHTHAQRCNTLLYYIYITFRIIY